MILIAGLITIHFPYYLLMIIYSNTKTYTKIIETFYSFKLNNLRPKCMLKYMSTFIYNWFIIYTSNSYTNT